MPGADRKSQLQKLFEASLRDWPVREAPYARHQVSPLALQAAVGLLFRYDEENDELDFLLTQRSRTLKQHPAEVSLPGGIIEEEERDQPLLALDREFFEEVGIPRGQAEWFPEPWDAFVSLHGIVVRPFVGFLPRGQVPAVLNLQTEEVEEAAWLSFDSLIDPSTWRTERFERPAGQLVQMPAWTGWASHRTWGLTALILATFVERVSGQKIVSGTEGL